MKIKSLSLPCFVFSLFFFSFLHADIPSVFAPSIISFDTRVRQPFLTTPTMNMHIFSKRKSRSEFCAAAVPCGYVQLLLTQNFTKGLFVGGEFDYTFYDPSFTGIKSGNINLGYTYSYDAFTSIDFVDLMIQSSWNMAQHNNTPSLLFIINTGLWNFLTIELLYNVFAQTIFYDHINCIGAGIKCDHLLDTFSFSINYTRTIFKNNNHKDTSNTTTLFFEYDGASCERPSLPVFNLAITFFSSNQPCYAHLDTTLGCGCNIEWCF